MKTKTEMTDSEEREIWKRGISAAMEHTGGPVRRIRMKDEAGDFYQWLVFRAKVAKGCPPGWMFVSHDGQARFVPGAWCFLAERFALVAGNYGFTHNLS